MAKGGNSRPIELSVKTLQDLQRTDGSILTDDSAQDYHLVPFTLRDVWPMKVKLFLRVRGD